MLDWKRGSLLWFMIRTTAVVCEGYKETGFHKAWKRFDFLTYLLTETVCAVYRLQDKCGRYWTDMLDNLTFTSQCSGVHS
jgi:hypothetical protein